MKTMVTDAYSPVRPSYLKISKPKDLQKLLSGSGEEAAQQKVNPKIYSSNVKLLQFREKEGQSCESPSSNSPARSLPSPQISLLEPPPPDVLSVSRRESSDSWHNFLIELNRILQDRVGEYV